MRQVRLCLMIGVPLLAGLFSVVEGRDANWDFLNYRWYNPFAFLHGKLATDVLVAGHATFFNPLLELPFYVIATHVPGIVAGFCVAALDGACFVPLFLLAERILILPDARHRAALAFLLALGGGTGGGALGQIGIVSWDMPLGILTITAMLVLLSEDHRALALRPDDVRGRLLLAGFLSGSAAGLKLTAAIYPLGLLAGVLAAGAGPAQDRVGRGFWFSLGAAAGIVAFGGLWMIRLYAAFGNPLMPFFNGLFHSPYAPPGSNRDSTFIPHDWPSILGFPFLFAANSRRVAEYDFRDVHVALAYALALVSTPAILLRRKGAAGIVARPAAVFLITMFLVSYAAWLFVFCIYRYIIPLEMLGPLVVVAAVSLLPVRRSWQAGLAAALVMLSALLVRAGFDRLPWTAHYVEIALPMTVQDDAMVLMTGSNPAGFVITALPPMVSVIRAGSALAANDRFGQIMGRRIDAHAGPMYTIFAAGDEEGNEATLRDHGLQRDQQECKPIVTNTSAALAICPVVRR